jgi:hypothetical protein
MQTSRKILSVLQLLKIGRKKSYLCSAKVSVSVSVWSKCPHIVDMDLLTDCCWQTIMGIYLTYRRSVEPLRHPSRLAY